MIASELIRSVSLDLNDQEAGYEFEHWPYALLKSYLLEALIQLSQIFYRLFVQKHIVKVEAGGSWQIGCCDCDQIVRIIGEVDKDGNIIRTLSRVMDNPDNEWPIGVADICQHEPDEYEMVGATIDAVDGRYFRVIPAMPEGTDHWVAIECYVHIHDVQDNDVIYWRLIPLCKYWMLGRAYLSDGENSPAMAQLGERYMSLYDSHVKLLHDSLAKEDEEKDFERDDTESRNAQNK